MGSFLYFIPDATTSDGVVVSVGGGGLITPEKAREIGLGYILNGANGLNQSRTRGGPGDVTGLMLTSSPPGGGPEPACGYYPARQEWMKGPEGRFWVGYDKSNPPRPEGLRREKLVDGVAVKLRDGNEWTVPIALSLLRRNTLPKQLTLGPDLQTWQLDELPEYRALCAAAESAFKWFGGTPDDDGQVKVSIPYQEGMSVAVAALETNYRVSALEVSLARLCSDTELVAILRAVCDIDAAEQAAADIAKKNLPDPATSPTAPGSAASDPTTPQPTAT